MLKHSKPQFSLGKTEVTRRSDCDAGPLLGSKIAYVPTPAAHQMLAGLAFQPHSGQQAVLMGSDALPIDFMAHKMLKSWNH